MTITPATKNDIKKLEKQIEELKGQCLAYQALLSSSSAAHLNFRKANEIIKNTIPWNMSKANTIARTILKDIKDKIENYDGGVITK